jgi:hypothetical protein
MTKEIKNWLRHVLLSIHFDWLRRVVAELFSVKLLPYDFTFILEFAGDACTAGNHHVFAAQPPELD